MKTLPSSRALRFFLLVNFGHLAVAAPVADPAAPNKYDVFAKALMPFVGVVAGKSKGSQDSQNAPENSPQNPQNPQNRAGSMTLRLEQMTGLGAEWVGKTARLQVEAPDKLRLQAPVLGEELTICRHGQEIWVAPGAKVAALLEAAAAFKKLPAANPKFELKPFALPVSEKQLVFLPALFQLSDVGTEPLDGAPCRVLDVELMSPLAKSLKVKDWMARIWVRPDSLLARITVSRPGWAIVLRIDECKFAPSLPAATWEPVPGTDVMKLTPVQYDQLLRSIVGGKP